MISQTEENYLKALLYLENKTEKITLSQLSQSLKVSTPTANSMVKKLHEKNYIEYSKYKPIVLTDMGRKNAALIIRKHRLTEMFLVEKMGFGWEEVHEIAEQIEHINSPSFFQRMDEILGSPTIDPHGSPIPDKEGNMNWRSYQKLNECKVGQTVRIAALSHSSDEFLKFLNKKKLSLGTELTIHHIEPFDQSMSINYLTMKEVAFSKEVCERLLVEVIGR